MQALATEGWEPLTAFRLGADVELLPAVWPPEHRCWVADRPPRFAVVSHGGDETFIEPELRNPERQHWELARTARSVGLPPPPRGRLWLLRSPWPGMRIGSLLLVIRQVRDDEGLGWDPVAMMRAAQRVLAGTEQQAWDRWHGLQADAARAWREAGVAGPDVDRWVELGLPPDDLAVLTMPVADGGAGLPVAAVPQWCEAISLGGDPRDDVVTRVVAWRSMGLPDDAAVGRLAPVMFDRQPSDVAPWLRAGFTAEDIAVWEAEDLPRATRWRDAGFTSRQARDLLSADPAVTPDEAQAFDAAGIESRSRLRWVAAGFSAQEARAWTDLGIVASEARVWRSLRLGPDVAHAQRASGATGTLPSGWEGGWAAMGSERDDMNFGVVDPPGTRGQTAAESLDPMWDVPRG